MRFQLLDRILEVQPGKFIKAEKYLTLGEEYLADHFPSFPVMPGVLMLQSLIEAGAWLLREASEFRQNIFVVREVRNVKYGSFMEPGRKLLITVDFQDSDDGLATFKGKGEAEGNITVSAKFSLVNPDVERADRGAAHRASGHWRELYEALRQRST